MTDKQNPLTIRRILVAIDASPHSVSAAEAAVGLAARLGAELTGMFVEDIDLLELANAPYARHVACPSAEETPVSRTGLESELKAQSEQARQALARAAERSKVAWSFRTVRGDVAAELLTAAAEADLIAIGRSGWSFGRKLRIGSTTLKIVSGKSPVLLLSEQRMFENARLIVCYDASTMAQKKLLISAQLASTGIEGLTILLYTGGTSRASQMKAEIEALLGEKKIELQYKEVDPHNNLELLQILQAEKFGVLVIAEHELFGPNQQTFLEVGLPLLLLDGELQAD
jgi:nucleotide-binding universal stress UspA family protein